jgi:phosphoglycolate phosphatase
MNPRMIVFDMDGTLVQARGAAWEIFQETAIRFELPIRSAEDFFTLFESNFFQGLDQVCANPLLAVQVRDHFMDALRERYTPRFIPGMVDVVKRLAPHYPLAVMSSNAMEAIRRTLVAGDVAQCFAHVFSADVDASKANHLGRIIGDKSYGGVRSCSPAYLEDRPPSGDEVILVTDTVGDVREGLEAGVHVVGVSWGMHSADSLTKAGAEFVACWPQELIARLLPGGSCAPGGCACETGSCQTTGSCTVRSALEPTLHTGQELARAATVRRTRRSRPPQDDHELGLALRRIDPST